MTRAALPASAGAGRAARPLAALALVLALCAGGVGDGTSASAAPCASPSPAVSSAGGACRAGWAWPVVGAGRGDVTAPFAPPAARWLAGHRGVDVRAGEGTALVSPCEGVVRFSGQVAGKSVVSVACDDGLVATFEPAVGVSARGGRVARGGALGVVGGGSDHCADGCVHWGARRGSSDYRDPLSLVGARRIGLKPW